MNKKLDQVLKMFFKKPIPANIKWNDFEKMIISLGGELDNSRSGSRDGVILNGKVTVLHRPHPGNEIDRGAVKAIRQFLELAGVRYDEI